MIYVSQKSIDGMRVGIKEIAKGTNAPLHFIAKIMQELSRKKLVQSVKGPNGGFYLNKQDLKITLSEIVKAIDGDFIYSDCVLGLKLCSEKTPCPVHNEYKEIRKQLIHLIEHNTIADFDKKLDSKLFFLK
jgi:Rrf2 family protein